MKLIRDLERMGRVRRVLQFCASETRDVAPDAVAFDAALAEDISALDRAADQRLDLVRMLGRQRRS